jgi:hypothetical protein
MGANRASGFHYNGKDVKNSKARQTKNPTTHTQAYLCIWVNCRIFTFLLSISWSYWCRVNLLWFWYYTFLFQFSFHHVKGNKTMARWMKKSRWGGFILVSTMIVYMFSALRLLIASDVAAPLSCLYLFINHGYHWTWNMTRWVLKKQLLPVCACKWGFICIFECSSFLEKRKVHHSQSPPPAWITPSYAGRVAVEGGWRSPASLQSCKMLLQISLRRHFFSFKLANLILLIKFVCSVFFLVPI